MLILCGLQLTITIREEIELKTHALAAYGGITDTARVNELIQRGWNLENEISLNGFGF